MPARIGAVELAGADYHPATLSQPASQGPSVVVRGPDPEVEAASWKIRRESQHTQNLPCEFQAVPIDAALLDHVGLVSPGSSGCALDRTRNHASSVLAHLAEIVHQPRVASIETGPDARQVRSLRQGMDAEHAVNPRRQDRAGRTLPGELQVALVAQHQHVVGAAPACCCGQVVESARRIARRVDPQAQSTRRVTGINAAQVDPPLIVNRHWHGPTPCQRRSHRVGRI